MIVYKHIRLDTNKVFYIGIAKRKTRPNSKANRNQHWHNIVNKVGFVSEIIYESDSWEEVCELEIFLIKEIGRRDLGLGPLVNMTDGGEGVLGLKGNIGHTGKKHSEETKEIISIKKKGSIPPNKGKIGVSQITSLKMSDAKKGKVTWNNGKIRSDEQKLNHSKKMKGGNNVRAKIVLNIQTGIYYDCVDDAAIAHNLNHRTLITYLSGHRPNKTNLKYV